MFRPYHPAIDSSNHRPIGESRTPGTARSSHSAIESWSSATAAGVAVPAEKAVVDRLAPGRINADPPGLGRGGLRDAVGDLVHGAVRQERPVHEVRPAGAGERRGEQIVHPQVQLRGEAADVDVPRVDELAAVLRGLPLREPAGGPAPSADTVAGLEQLDRNAGLRQPVGRGQARQAGPDHDDASVVRGAAGRGVRRRALRAEGARGERRPGADHPAVPQELAAGDRTPLDPGDRILEPRALLTADEGRLRVFLDRAQEGGLPASAHAGTIQPPLPCARSESVS